MIVDDAYKELAGCLWALPINFPKPRLVVHESPESMVLFLGAELHEFHVANEFSASRVDAIADAERNCIHIPHTVIYSSTVNDLRRLFIHEIGHLRHAQRYGNKSKEFLDEDKANAFERRWYPKVEAILKKGNP